MLFIASFVCFCFNLIYFSNIPKEETTTYDYLFPVLGGVLYTICTIKDIGVLNVGLKTLLCFMALLGLVNAMAVTDKKGHPAQQIAGILALITLITLLINLILFLYK